MKTQRSRQLVGAAITAITMSAANAYAQVPAQTPPNVVVILADDLGYSDLSCYGSPSIKTPRLDRMAAEGTRFTDGYSAGAVCTPSRAGLLTGCYPQRIGNSFLEAEHGPGKPGSVYFPRSRGGLNPEEVTIAEVLKGHGYATSMIGKWHLGDAPQFLPTRQGFDSYFGIPYSNDLRPSVLLRGEKVESDVDQPKLLATYTEEAVKFIKHKHEKPFFLYLAHNAPHTPIHASEKFKGKSARGLYGDVVEELDWGVGEVLDALKASGADENTLVIFTSDNGPWYARGERGGSAFPLRGGKGTSYEGGTRVPLIVRWPGHVPAGRVSHEPICSIDFLPTLTKLTGAAASDRKIDGRDVSPIVLGTADEKQTQELDERPVIYFNAGRAEGVRQGRWKLRVDTEALELQFARQAATQPAGTPRPPLEEASIPIVLYDLAWDLGEQKTVAQHHPDVVERLQKILSDARHEMGDKRTGITGEGARKAGRLAKDEPVANYGRREDGATIIAEPGAPAGDEK